MSKMRLKPATIGVVRSCAIPHAVKHEINAIKRINIPRPSKGSPRVVSDSAGASTGLAADTTTPRHTVSKSDDAAGVPGLITGLPTQNDRAKRVSHADRAAR